MIKENSMKLVSKEDKTVVAEGINELAVVAEGFKTLVYQLATSMNKENNLDFAFIMGNMLHQADDLVILINSDSIDDENRASLETIEHDVMHVTSVNLNLTDKEAFNEAMMEIAKTTFEKAGYDLVESCGNCDNCSCNNE
jgi:hypothetical protein